MPAFEPFLIVFFGIVLMQLIARRLVLRHLMAFSGVSFVSVLGAQVLGSPHVFFYLGVLLAITIEIQLWTAGFRGIAARAFVPSVILVWVVSLAAFPTKYGDIAKWLMVFVFLIFLVLYATNPSKPSEKSTSD